MISLAGLIWAMINPMSYNVFISIGFLSRKLDLAGLSNTMLVAGEQGKYTSCAIEDSVQSHWSLKDLGLSVEKRKENGIYDLTSNRVFIDTIVQQAIDTGRIAASGGYYLPCK